jgi:hypothetical protein
VSSDGQYTYPAPARQPPGVVVSPPIAAVCVTSVRVAGDVCAEAEEASSKRPRTANRVLETKRVPGAHEASRRPLAGFISFFVSIIIDFLVQKVV